MCLLLLLLCGLLLFHFFKTEDPISRETFAIIAWIGPTRDVRLHGAVWCFVSFYRLISCSNLDLAVRVVSRLVLSRPEVRQTALRPLYYACQWTRDRTEFAWNGMTSMIGEGRWYCLGRAL